MGFPELTVCLNCGFSEFVVPERELHVLVQDIPVRGATPYVEEKKLRT